MARKCKCGCRAEIKPAAKCTTYMEKLGFATEECQQKAAMVALDKLRAKNERKAKADRVKTEKAERTKHKAEKERVKRRSEWLDNLQTLVNQWVVHVRDKDEPCCTCGKTKQNIKYDAGHMISRGSSPELRFELTNIHKQCSIECNVHGSGKRKEYELFIIKKYGQAHLDWLLGPQKSLKEQFPHYTDIKSEIQRFRKLLRQAGLKPNY
jgi:hypothetical protein